jgi:hypothetical protein
VKKRSWIDQSVIQFPACIFRVIRRKCRALATTRMSDLPHANSRRMSLSANTRRMAITHGATRLRLVSIIGNSTTWRALVTSRTAGLADSGATGQAIQSLHLDGDRACAS